MHYLDYAATTPPCEHAIQAAIAAMQVHWGNPSSTYPLGQDAAALVAQCRADVASGLGCAPQELLFTSCGTESDNWAINAAVQLGRRKGKHIITTAIEHAAVLEPLRKLEREGYEVSYLKPDKQGNITPAQLEQVLREDTILVSMMLVNNELGSVLPVAQAAQLLKDKKSGALLHCDAIQAFLKLPFTPAQLGVDFLCVSAHKIYAPKGIGALYVRRGLNIAPMLYGGGQESTLRSGTEATAQMSAFAAAVRMGSEHLQENLAHLTQIKQYTLAQLTQHLPQIVVLTQNGAPHILSVSLVGYKSEVVVRFLAQKEIYISSGSACHKGKLSHVVQALNLPKKVAEGVLRISFSHLTQTQDIDALVQGLVQASEQLFPSMS